MSIAPRESVTCVIPAFNEEATIQIVVERLLQGQFDVLVVDGGSSDSTVQIVSKLCKVIVSEAGRATQMNAGAALCETEWLWFLHADSVLLAAPETYFSAIKSGSKDWGFFTPKLSGSGFTFRLIEKAMALRSKLTFVATGDQGLFVRRAVFDAENGFAAIPLMEDVELCKRLRASSSPNTSHLKLQTSSRRWEQKGRIKTILLMWQLRLLYWLGVSPDSLAARYR